MNVQTFIFGNPDGWKLYNKDQSEVSYFKSFYVNSRRGPRLMVHRRYDGSVVYAWLMYGIKEIIEEIEETKKGRGGIGHIGFAMILPDNNYIPEFRLVYSFFSTLFYKMLERKDSPVGVNKSGEKLPYAYLIHKFDEAKPVMEWLRSNMPNVLKKCTLRSITDDREFSDELSGRIATLSDEASDGEILNAFKRNSWVAISPEYRTKVADANAEATIELNLFDVTRLHTKLTGSLLEWVEWAIAGSTISRKQMDDMLAKINDARGLLAAYVKNITDESEIKEVTHLQHEFSSLGDKVEQLKKKQDSLHVDTDYKVDPLPPDPPGPIDDRHDNVADKPLPGSQHDKNVALPYRLVGGVFVVIALLIIALVKCSGSDATEADIWEADTLCIREVDADAFNDALEEGRFKNAYEMLKGASDSITRTASLKAKIEDYLWKLVTGDSKVEIPRFLWENIEMCQALGFVDDDHNDIHNGGKEWNARYENYHTLKELLDKEKPTSKEHNRAVQLAGTLGHFDFTRQLDEMLAKVKNAEAEAHRQQTVETAPVDPGNSEDLIVTCHGQKKPLGTNTGLGFDVPITNDTIKMTSNFKLSFKSTPGVTVNASKDYKSFSLKSTKPAQFILECKAKNVKVTINFVKK